MADTTYSGNTNDPNYARASEYPSDTGAYAGGPGAHPTGVGAPIDAYGDQNAASQGYSGTGGTATGVTGGRGFGSHTGPGAGTVGGMAGHQLNQPTTGTGTGYDQRGYGQDQTSGYGYDQSGGYGGQPGTSPTTATSHPIRSELGATGPGTGAGHTGGLTGTGAATGATAGGLAGQGGQYGTAPTTGAAGTGNMSLKDAKKLEMKGKFQQLGGLLVSSESMKAKGAAKEREAAAIRHHQTNISTAEAHEAQARLARERAGQGAYH